MATVKTKLFLALGLVILAISNLSFVAVAAPVSTQGGNSQVPSIKQRAYTWSVVRTINDNGNTDCKLDDKISATDAQNAAFLPDGGSSQSIGHHVDSADGRVKCNEASTWLKTAMDFWGYEDPGEFLLAIGYTLQGSDYVYNGDDANTKFINAVPAKFFTNGKNAASNDVLYYIFKENFVQGCGATAYKPYADATQSERLAIDSDDKTYRITYVDETTGKKIDYIYKADKGKGEIVSVGLGVGTNRPGEADCLELSQKLSDPTLANAYAALITQAVKEGNLDDVLGNNDNASKEASASCVADVPVLGWIICSIAEVADDFVGWVDRQLVSLLQISPAEYNEGGLKTAWSAMRIIATVALVGVALFMIISQMLNFDAVSAYTIKKVVPRLVIATILIQLSWYLFVGLIVITNTIAVGLAELIYAPFGGADQVGDITSILGSYYDKIPGSGNGTALGNTTFLGVAIVGGLAAIGGGIGLLAAALGVLIAVLVGFTVLVLRKVAIIFLLIIAPLALVAWILPNTQRWWSTWWSLFSRLLIMYPIIIGLLAVGKVFAYVVATAPVNSAGAVLDTAQQFRFANFAAAGATSDQIRFFVILIAYFGPYLLIPATFSVAGGIFSKATAALTGFGNKVKAGDLGGFKKQAASNKEARESYRKNRAYQTLANPDANAISKFRARQRTGTLGYGIRKSTRAAYSERSALAQQAGEESIEKAAIAELTRNGYNGLDYKGKEALLITSTSTALGEDISVTDGNGRTVTVKNSDAIKRQLLSNAATTGNINALRSVREKVDKGMWESVINGKHFTSVKPLAPDLVMPASQAFNDVKSDEMVSWKDSTMKEAITHYRTQLDAAQTPEEQAVAKAAVSRFSQAVSQIANDPKLSGRMSNETLSVIANRRNDVEQMFTESGVDASVTESGVRRINTDGRIIVQSQSTPSSTAPPTIRFVEDNATQDASRFMTVAQVQAQVNAAGGINQLPDRDVYDLYSHANSQWSEDIQGTQLGNEARSELQRRGILPPDNSGTN